MLLLKHAAGPLSLAHGALAFEAIKGLTNQVTGTQHGAAHADRNDEQDQGPRLVLKFHDVWSIGTSEAS